MTGSIAYIACKELLFLAKEVLCLACRENIREMLLAAAFEVSLWTCSGPEVSLLKYFRKEWNKNIDQTVFQCGFETSIVSVDISLDVVNFGKIWNYPRTFQEVILRNCWN